MTAQHHDQRHSRIALMGLAIDRLTEAEAIGHIMDALDAGRGGWAITPNVDQLRQFRARPELRSLFDAADLVLADGMPLVWASRLQRTPLPMRIAGSELVWSLTAEAALEGRSIYLLGDCERARELAERKIGLIYPGARIAGSYSPPIGFERDELELDRIRERLRAARPDIVYVALGFPKQERLIARLRAELPSTWFIGVGKSISFIGGYAKRAPDWMASLGLEWLHRVAQEPRRLARRYLVHGIPFAVRLLAHALAARVLARVAAAGAGPPRSSRRVVFARGSLERARAETLGDLLDETGEASAAERA